MASEAPRRVHQLVGALHHGDAVGNEVLALRSLLRASGLESEIGSGEADGRLDAERRPLAGLAADASAEDVGLYHFSPGSPATEAALAWPGRLAVVYHNVTPARFFAAWDPEAARLALRAAAELRALVPRAALALAKSAFSRRDLDEAGFARTGVMPYVHELAAAPAPSRVLRRLYGDGRTNVLSVGRLAPNKRVEDVLRAFALFQRAVPRSRLILAGDRRPESYVRSLVALARGLRLRERDVVLCGKVEADELRALYAVAHVYVSLSDHEGYGVPLVEAALACVPVLARDAGAVAETLDGAGLLVGPDAPLTVVAALLEGLARDEALRREVLAGQERLAHRVRSTDFRARVLEALAPLLGPRR
jgi:glycosyltransferase involved in cell wall biosynthesis